jgi:uncharacterized membrane protein YfcA
MDYLLVFMAIGVAAGILAGLLGVGGGIIVVPLLAYVFYSKGFPAEHIMHLAVATSMAIMVFTSLSSLFAHHRHRAIDWPVVRRLSPGLVVGALLGAWIAGQLSTTVLKTVFGLFELVVAAQLALNLQPRSARQLPGQAGLAGVGMAMGSLSSMLGVGGGILVVPYLMWCNVRVRTAVATSSACGFSLTTAGAAGYIFAAPAEQVPVDFTAGYIYLPALIMVALGSVSFAPLGARLAHRLPTAVLQRIFAVFLVLMGMAMLIG